MDALVAFSETGLVRYDNACRAVAEAASVDEAKDFRDKAEAMRAYARQAKNRQLEVDAAEIRFRAERRIGELMAAQRDADMMAKPGPKIGSASDPNYFPSLSDAGIDKHLADRARKFAAIPRDEFDGIVDEWRGRITEENARVTTNLLEASKKHVHVSANSGNNEWYTPREIIEAALTVLGGIDLDPASSSKANETVGAAKYFTAEDDGLSREWPIGRIWMNPPYAQPLVSQFADKYAEEVERGSCGIVLVNNATETGWFHRILGVSEAVCFPRGRVRYLSPDHVVMGAPLQGQALLYAGDAPNYFADHFSRFGPVLFTGSGSRLNA